jgi:hypothetical protein
MGHHDKRSHVEKRCCRNRERDKEEVIICMDRIQTILAKVGYFIQCFGSIVSESGFRYFDEYGSGSRLMLNLDLIRTGI